MGTLGNSEAVRQAQLAERRPEKAESPAKETATAKRAKAPERTPEPVDEFAERLRRSIPGIPDEAIEELRKHYEK